MALTLLVVHGTGNTAEAEPLRCGSLMARASDPTQWAAEQLSVLSHPFYRPVQQPVIGMRPVAWAVNTAKLTNGDRQAEVSCQLTHVR